MELSTLRCKEISALLDRAHEIMNDIHGVRCGETLSYTIEARRGDVTSTMPIAVSKEDVIAMYERKFDVVKAELMAYGIEIKLDIPRCETAAAPASTTDGLAA